MLQISNLNAGYSASHVLYDLNLSVKPNEIVSIIGRNGVGKTTTLKAIMGLIRVISGSVKIDGKEVAGQATHKIARHNVAFVPDDRGIFVNLTTAENLKIPFIGHKNAQRDALDEVFELFPILKERLDQKAGTLSGGEQQMLTIARGMVIRPKLLILDEISEGLAPEIIANCCAAFKKIKSRTTILMAEQDVRAALSVSDRIYIMLNGTVAFEGTVPEVHEQQAIEKYINL